ncbi:hypothetical protein [Spongiibacter tropicus]|uniref:hypothetical protein n=1 Tax=Spongiibacter tropicus TaxID=454602 RepID=UPI002354F947|nr:hypothetical protein [Spongiibacter tropicus]
MTILFTLGLYQDVRPERWASKHSVFYGLATSLSKLGYESVFLCNQKSVKSKYVSKKFRYYFEGDTAVLDVFEKEDISHVVIWGGRTVGDDRLRSECPGGTEFIYAEAGWFPQPGTCYFSQFGTNANARFQEEGLVEHSLNRRAFVLSRWKKLRSSLGLLELIKAPSFFEMKRFDPRKPIFVPLQDEGDTNILLSSPVKKMADFIDKLADLYPSVIFVVRPHPRATYSSLPQRNNVKYQQTTLSPYANYSMYGGVIGINSTMLLQFALLGLPVAGVGSGVATGNGAYYDLNYDEFPSDLAEITYDAVPTAKFFDYLIRKKQLDVKKLKSSAYVKNSYVIDFWGERGLREI